MEEQLEKGTVALNSAGFFIQPLAVICEALLEALQLPVWLNIYITAAGKTKSAPAHTDKQDVIAIQTEGSKRWRVFRPPPTADKVCAVSLPASPWFAFAPRVASVRVWKRGRRMRGKKRA